jgi:hypothetical protein
VIFLLTCATSANHWLSYCCASATVVAGEPPTAAADEPVAAAVAAAAAADCGRAREFGFSTAAAAAGPWRVARAGACATGRASAEACEFAL